MSDKEVRVTGWSMLAVAIICVIGGFLIGITV